MNFLIEFLNVGRKSILFLTFNFFNCCRKKEKMLNEEIKENKKTKNYFQAENQDNCKLIYMKEKKQKK